MAGLYHAKAAGAALAVTLLTASSAGSADAVAPLSAISICGANAPSLRATMLAELKDGSMRFCGAPSESQGDPEKSAVVVWDPGKAAWARSAAIPMAGAALVLNRQGDTWRVHRTLRSPRPLAYGRFGIQLALAENVLIVLQATPASVWTYGLPVQAQGAEIADARGFARSVTAVGRKVIVGGTGEARIYGQTKTGWRVEERVVAPATAPELFTGQITATPELLVATVAGLNRGDGIVDQGRVDVFRHSSEGWGWDATLRPAGTDAPFGFDCCVAIVGKDVIVTAGSVSRRFRRTSSGWSEHDGSNE